MDGRLNCFRTLNPARGVYVKGTRVIAGWLPRTRSQNTVDCSAATVDGVTYHAPSPLNFTGVLRSSLAIIAHTQRGALGMRLTCSLQRVSGYVFTHDG